MGELMEYEDYEHFKAALDRELLSAADHFVKIGYLLKQARDTTILYESGYPNLYEFAKAEYGIDKGTVSRYIAINDRFSVGGNSPALEQRYSNRGVAKLQEMLTMSDEVIEVIPAETTKAELQDIKKDIKAEENITDMEVMLEDIPSTPVKTDCWYQQAIYYHLQNNPEIFTRIYAAMQNDPVGDKDVVLALAPNGVATPRARVPKVGTVLMSIQGTELPMAFVNVRTNEHETVPWAWIANTNKAGMNGAALRKQYINGYMEWRCSNKMNQSKKQSLRDIQAQRNRSQKIMKKWTTLLITMWINIQRKSRKRIKVPILQRKRLSRKLVRMKSNRLTKSRLR